MFRVLIAALLVIGCGAVYLWLRPSQPGVSPKAKNQVPVSVSAVPAVRKDVPLLLNGIGTAQALNTVQIKSRVDGALDQVNFVEGQHVRKGDVLAVIDPRIYRAALDQMKAKLEQDQAQLISDQKDLERSKQLVTNQFASQQTFDQLTAKVGVDKALIEGDKAMVASAQTNLDYTVITAPFDGLMGLRNIDPGNIVHANDNIAIATLTQQEPIFVLFTLPEGELPKVRAAFAQGDVPVVALNQEGAAPVAEGMLRVVDNQIDQASGTLRLKAQFANHDGALWPGQFTPVTIKVGIQKNAIVTPSAAVQRGPNGLYLWIAKQDGHADMREIETGVSHQGDMVVTKGLNEDELIITSNQYRLQPNSLVRVEQSSVASNTIAGRS